MHWLLVCFWVHFKLLIITFKKPCMAWDQVTWGTISYHWDWPAPSPLGEEVCCGPHESRNSNWQSPGERPSLTLFLPFVTSYCLKWDWLPPFWPSARASRPSSRRCLGPQWGSITLDLIDELPLPQASCFLPPHLLNIILFSMGIPFLLF